MTHNGGHYIKKTDTVTGRGWGGLRLAGGDLFSPLCPSSDSPQEAFSLKHRSQRNHLEDSPWSLKVEYVGIHQTILESHKKIKIKKPKEYSAVSLLPSGGDHLFLNNASQS